MKRLALLVLLGACASAPESQRMTCRLPLAGDLAGALRLAPVEAASLLLVPYRDEGPAAGDALWVVDLERASAVERPCQPRSSTPGFGAALCVSVDARRVLVGAVSRTQGREPGRVLVYRWPELQLEFELRGEAAGDGFGSSIAEIADQDGDSRPDYAIGAPRPGALLLVSGADGRILRRIEEPGLGLALASCADCDGDGVPELAALCAGGLELRSGRELRLLRTLATDGGMWPALFGGAGLALLEDDGGSWPYSSHKTVTAWSAGKFEQLCQWKPDRHALLYRSPGDLYGARIVYPDGNQLVSSDVRGKDERELAPRENRLLRAACEIRSGGPTRWRTAVVLGLEGGRGNELLLTTR
jgi:hypothetical protein